MSTEPPPAPEEPHRSRWRDVVLVVLSLVVGIAVAALFLQRDDTTTSRSSAGPRPSIASVAPSVAAASGAAVPSPAAPAPDAISTVRGFLEAESKGDPAASYGFLSTDDRHTYPSIASWVAAHANLLPITGFELGDQRDAGGPVEVSTTLTLRAGLDEVLGLVPANANAAWAAVPEDGGWRLAFKASTVEAVYLPDTEAAAAARRWVSAGVACQAPEQYEGGLVGSPALADPLCGDVDEPTFGAATTLDDAELVPIVNAFGPQARTWARLIAVRGSVPIDVVLAPVGDRWLVVGVLAPGHGG